MYPTNSEETAWKVIMKISNLQERERKYDLCNTPFFHLK